MKTPIGAALLLLGTHLSFAEHLSGAYYQPTEAVVYDQPVVYQAPVVYTAPVVYNAPVTYVNPVAAPVAVQAVAPMQPVVNMNVSPVYQPCNASYSPHVYQVPCSSPNVFIGPRAYRITWENTPSVIHVGGGHADYGRLRRY